MLPHLLRGLFFAVGTGANVLFQEQFPLLLDGLHGDYQEAPAHPDCWTPAWRHLNRTHWPALLLLLVLQAICPRAVSETLVMGLRRSQPCLTAAKANQVTAHARTREITQYTSHPERDDPDLALSA